jgi:hypothetical protein
MMDEAVTRSSHFPPWQVWILVCYRFWNILGGFTKYFEIG